MSDPKTLYAECRICPRNCGINRNDGLKGFCKENAQLKIASACLHFGEEPPITVDNGSGTIFITGCNLRCSFCQNYQISQCGMGAILETKDFVRMCMTLQQEGAENINIVTGSHAVPVIIENLKEAKKAGLQIPICWNSSAYESISELESLKEVVDIWLPDLKTINPLISDAVFKAIDYPSIAKKAIRWMVQNTESHFITTPSGKEKMMSGVIIRHLVLPGRMDDTRLVLEWLKKVADREDDHNACISLMSQYTPVKEDNALFSENELITRRAALKAFDNRLLNQKEFVNIQSLIKEYDFQYLFYQELESDTEWLPDFSKTQPFSNKLAKPIWHWKTGFII